MPRVPAGGEPTGAIAFRALRDGTPLGTHRVDFRHTGDRLLVEITIQFEVKLLLFPVYRYHHTNHETWQDGRLVAIETRTDDNGEPFQVSGRAGRDAFEVEGTSGRLSLPPDVVPSSYWSEAIGTRGEWLDTQAGRLARSAVKQQPAETVEVGGRMVQATRYALIGDITCDLWYHDGGWVKLLFTGQDGSTIDYVRMA